MMPALWRDSPNDVRCLCWFSANSLDARCRHIGWARHHDQNTQNLVVQNPRCYPRGSFTLPIRLMPRGQIDRAATAFLHPHD